MTTLDPVPAGVPEPADLLGRIREQGYALVRLEADEARKLAAVHRGVMEFFAQSPSAKARHGAANRGTGYRPYAYAHAGDPARPDHNDSYLYWGRERRLPENHEEIEPLLDALEAYRLVAARVTRELVEELRTHYGYADVLPFERASVLQINSFGTPTDEELLQQPHEDAVFLTVIWTSAEGLEGVTEGGTVPFAFAPDEVMIMPGGLMTVMTGGQIPPFYHQVRNHGTLGRKSVMYFVSPDPTGPIEPFLRNASNRDADVRALVIDNPQTFGLADDFVVAA